MPRSPQTPPEPDARADVPLDPRKPAGWHDDACAACYRSDCALRECAAADCYAAFCHAHAPSAKEGDGPFVCPMCAHGAARVPTAYGADAGSPARRADKERANAIFWDAVEAALRRRGSPSAARVLVLDHDGGSVRSAAARPAIARAARLVVTNPDAACRRAVRRAARAAGVRVATASRRVGAYLTSVRGRKRFAAVWIDMCGTFDGGPGTHIYPRHDVRKLLEYGLDYASGPAVLAATFCKRNAHTPADDALDWIAQTARIHGAQATLAERFDYGNMFMVVFLIKRANRPSEQQLLQAGAPWMSAELARALADPSRDEWPALDGRPEPLRGHGIAGARLRLRTCGAWHDAVALFPVPRADGWCVAAFCKPEPGGLTCLDLVNVDGSDDNVKRA